MILDSDYPDADRRLDDRRSNNVRFDKSINLGNIISMIVLVITLTSIGTKILERMDAMEFKVNAMWEQFSVTLKDKK